MLYEKLSVDQKRAVRYLITRKSLCLFFEQGVGKTHPTLGCIECLMDEPFQGLLVVPLTNLNTTWLKLIQKELPQLNVTSDWSEFKKMASPKLLLVNYEALPKIRKPISTFKWTFAGFDESQRLKARGSKQSRIAGSIKFAEYRIILSGTPIDESPIDLWAQLRFAVPHLYGNDRSAWRRFDDKYLKKCGYMGYQRKFRPDMLPIFYEEIKPYVYRKEAEGLPPLHTKLVPVKMNGEQESLYLDMERDMVAHIRRAQAEKERAKELGKPINKKLRVSAGLRITQIIKLQQLCGGFVVDDSGELITLRSSAKLVKLENLLQNTLELPTVIFCKYTEERLMIEKLFNKLGLSFGSIHGGVKDGARIKHRSNIIEKFQSGKLDGMICQIKAGGVGVDLFKGKSTVFYSTTFSYIDYEQAKKRVHRRGQKHEVTIFFIFIKNTIDEDIYSRILSKKSVSKSMFSKMKRRSLSNGKY